MIDKIEVGTTYYRGSIKFPFLAIETCTKINKDGTIDVNGVPRRMVETNALSNWCLTKEEAFQEMVDYWLTFKEKDMSQKADNYRIFVEDMRNYLEKYRPEYLI